MLNDSCNINRHFCNMLDSTILQYIIYICKCLLDHDVSFHLHTVLGTWWLLIISIHYVLKGSFIIPCRKLGCVLFQSNIFLILYSLVSSFRCFSAKIMPLEYICWIWNLNSNFNDNQFPSIWFSTSCIVACHYPWYLTSIVSSKAYCKSIKNNIELYHNETLIKWHKFTLTIY